MLQLKKNITGSCFTAFLDLCFKYSTYFSFTQNPVKEYAESSDHINFLEKFSQFYVKTIETRHWHCYYVPEGYNKKVYLFNVDRKAQDYIKEYFDNLYLIDFNGENPGGFSIFPQDLCFFVGNKLFVGTVSHEDICNVYPFSEQVKKELLLLTKWNLVEDRKEEQIMLDTK